MRTVIVDDEKQIREGLKVMLSQVDLVEIIGEASTLSEAKELIKHLQPDLVLLDIQLKNQTGFEMLDSLPNMDFKLIFITAYNEYAIKAFKYSTFDYLLKPIDPEELYDTIERLKQQETDSREQLQLLKKNKKLQNIIIKTINNIYVLPIHEILRCEADKGYTHFYMIDGKHILSSKTLKEYYILLPEEQFIRVHQSHLINWQQVASYDIKGILTLKNKDKIPVSVRKRQYVTELLKQL